MADDQSLDNEQSPGIDIEALKKAIESSKIEMPSGDAQNTPDTQSLSPENLRSLATQAPEPIPQQDVSSAPKSEESGTEGFPDQFYKSLLSKYQGIINKPKDNSEMQDAIKQRNMSQLIAGLGDSGQTIGAAISRMQANPNAFSAIRQQAEQPVSDVAARQKAEQEKTKSIESLLEKLGVAKEAALTRKEIAEQNRLAREALAGNKSEEKRNQYITQTNQLLESARGNSAVQQAQKDIYSADKAQALFSKYKDPNQISPQELKLFVSEVSKIAQGGVPTMTEMQALTPNTLATKFADVSSKLLNKPTPANAAEFIKRYESYLQDLKHEGQKVVDSKIGRVLETRKNMIGEDAYNQFKDQYGLNKESKQPEAQLSDQDKQAIQWAKSNPNDPRAKQILSLHGM